MVWVNGMVVMGVEVVGGVRDGGGRGGRDGGGERMLVEMEEKEKVVTG